MKMAISMLAIAFATPGLADGHQPQLSELITDTIGYVSISPGVVLLEGDEFGAFICKIDASDAAFANYAATGDTGGEEIGYACIPVEEFDN